MAVLPGGIAADGSFWSPMGASYGSIVTRDLSFKRCMSIADSFIKHCKDQQFPHAYLIPPPQVYSDVLNQHFEYSLLYRQADFELHYISHVIDLSSFRQKGIASYDATTRNVVRKILRDGHIRIGESDDLESFHNILVENKARHSAKPTHSLQDLYRLKELVPGNLRLNMVWLDDKPIAGSLLFLVNRSVVLTFYNMMLYEYEHYKPVYLIMHETCRWAAENGYRYVDIGVSQDTTSPNPMTPSLGLIDFKECFNARGILRSTYHLKL